MNITDIFMVCMALFLFICGKKWSKGKWLNLMAGYNTMSDKEKENCNIEKTKKIGSIMLYICAIWCLVLDGISFLFYNEKIKMSKMSYDNCIICLIIVLLVVVFVCIYLINKK